MATRTDTMLAIGRLWADRQGGEADEMVELVFTGRRLAQVLIRELPPQLAQWVQTLPKNTIVWADRLPPDLRSEWEQLAYRQAPLAVTLAKANEGFKRGDDPPLEAPLVRQNKLLFSLYDPFFCRDATANPGC